MTALAAELMVTFDRWTRKQLPLGGSFKAYKGGAAVGDPTNHVVRPATSGTNNFVPLGIFAETIDNSAATTGGATMLCDVDFLKEKTVLWRANAGNITAAGNLFGPCYYLDDQTVTATAGSNTKAGTVLAVDSVLGVAFEVEGA